MESIEPPAPPANFNKGHAAAIGLGDTSAFLTPHNPYSLCNQDMGVIMAELREPRDLAASLGDLFNSGDYIYECSFSDEDSARIADWLYLAAGLESVYLDRARFLPDFGFCRGADSYELARDELLIGTTSELTRFLFCWCALEALVELIRPPLVPNRPGKINFACQLIRSQFGDIPVAGVESALASLRSSLAGWNASSKLLARLERVSEYGKSAVALHGIYELRNELAHGSLRLPTLPEQTAIVKSIRLSSLLTLVSVQMLLIANKPDVHCTISLVSGVPFLDCDVQTVLRHLHLLDRDWPEGVDI